MRSAPIRSLFAFLLASSVGLAQEPARDSRESSQAATLQTLLNEVHALRVALERSNQIAPRVQITLAKMQLAEERVRNANRQLLDARDALMHIQTKIAEGADHVKQVEARLTQTVDPKERMQFNLDLESMKGEIAQLSTQETQFRTKEAEASSLLMSEQAKWNEVNDLLTAIERALIPQP
jgi:hypothetical protein